MVSVSAVKSLPVNMNSPFGRLMPFPFGRQPPGEQHGTGSGVIVGADGIVLTNHHVIQGAKEIKVTLPDGVVVGADVLGSDAKSDLAVLRLKNPTKNLVPIPLGKSSELRLGEPVLAIGNPFGVGQTVTQGIVSAKGRADLGINANEDFIQTDAAINPGNSGGALVNMRGQLVGINTAILSRSGGSMGIGFAIPTDMAKPIMKSLIQKGHVDRGWLGVTIQDVDGELGKALGLGSKKGVLIAEVRSGSPADRAGLKRGDVVVKVGKTAVRTTGQLRNAVALAGAHKKAEVTVIRDGRMLSMRVTLGTAPDEAQVFTEPTASGSGSVSGSSSLDGLTLEPLDQQTREQLRVGDHVRGGLVVTSVEPGSAAARAGLRGGDVILEVDKKPISDLESFASAWKARGERTLLLVLRQGTTLFLVARRATP